jgi:hypothetical protein
VLVTKINAQFVTRIGIEVRVGQKIETKFDDPLG